MGRRVKLVLAALLVASSAPAHSAGKGAAVAQAQPVPDDAVYVGEIAFEGADPKGLSTLVAIQEGALLDGRIVREAVRALHGSARFARVAAYTEPLPAEKLRPGWTRAVRLVFVLAPVRKLVALSFPGRAALPETVLAQTANLQVNTEFQDALVRRAADAIQAAYYRIGYRAARVTPMPRPGADGIALDLRIEEGNPTRVAGVRFAGAPGLSPEELSFAFRVAPGDVLNLSALDEGVRGLRERYRRAGRLRARVGAPLVEEESGASARVVVGAAGLACGTGTTTNGVNGTGPTTGPNTPVLTTLSVALGASTLPAVLTTQRHLRRLPGVWSSRQPCLRPDRATCMARPRSLGPTRLQRLPGRLGPNRARRKSRRQPVPSK